MANTPADTNIHVASLLRDLASVQKSTQSKWGYKRAARAILDLDEPIERLLQPDGTLRKIPNVGPSSLRVVMEALETGASPTVERAIAAAGKNADVAKSRALRTNFLSRAQVVAALRNPRLRGPQPADYLGDLQMHSVWSDGSDSLQDLIEACLARGYRYCAITDHSYGLPIAGGVSMADLARQHDEIDRLNHGFAGRFRMLKGIEANIRADGSIDMKPDELARIELVVASPHSSLRSPTDQTPRMIAAVTAPGVHILGHPRGRMFGSRPGVTARWDDVFAAAARSKVAIEIDGDPARQDLDFELARRAVAAGCLIAVDSDAHSGAELSYTDTALAHARLAAVPTDRVINCWPLDRLLEWADERRRPYLPGIHNDRAVSS
jgi:histidinol phosphatase-like PHP family hydrolase